MLKSNTNSSSHEQQMLTTKFAKLRDQYNKEQQALRDKYKPEFDKLIIQLSKFN